MGQLVMSDIFGIAASAAGGGVFGLIGTIAGRITGFWETKQKLEHEQKRWRHDAEMLTIKTAADRERAEANLSLAETEGSWAGLKSSIEADASIETSYLWVSAVRGLTRPFLTLMLWVITALIFFNVAPDQRENLIETATFAATAATLWWFGDRGPQSAPRFSGPTDRIIKAGGDPVG
jgi:hypothetical protein